MDKILEGVLKGARLSVDYSIKTYNDEKDISFVETSIEGLSEMITTVEYSGKKEEMDDFLEALKGMRDELNVIVENHNMNKYFGVYV